MINKVKVGDTSHDINDARIGTFETSLSSNSNTSVPSSKAVADYVSSQMTSVLTYKGTIGSSGATVTALPASHKVGDVYVVATAGTYAGKAVEVGDYIICKTAGTSANNAHWDVVNGENQVENKSASLAAAGSSATIATIDGTNITVTTPSTWKLTDNNTTYKININGTDTGGGSTSLGTVYTPTTSGTAGQVLTSAGSGAPVWKTGELVHYVTSPSGTAGNTASGSYNRTQWTGTCDGVTSLYTGLMIAIKVPVAGVSRGVSLDINSLGEHPLLYNAGLLTTHYPVDSIATFIYDASATASIYVNNTNTSFTGCWKSLADYDANSDVYIRLYKQLTNNSTWNQDYPLVASRTLASSITETDGKYAATYGLIGGNAVTPTVNPITGAVKVKSLALNGIALESKTAASGGTDVSLVTTGEKYTWNNKSDLAIGTTASTAAAGNHTHTTSLAADSGTSTVNLAANTTYKLTAGGTSVIFKTPANNTTTGSLITNATTAQTASSGESMSSNITLHKVSKTGSYSDLLNKPTIPTVPTISTNISSDATSDTKTASPKAVKTYVDNMCGNIETLLAAI